MRQEILHAECLEGLSRLEDGVARLLYVDPPFNTGKTQKRQRIRARRDEEAGDRVGFGGRRYATERVASAAYADRFDDYVGWLLPRIEASLRVLTPDASLFVHLDWRESHYVKVALDGLLGRKSFMNEIVWAYDFGGRSKSRWSAKHDSILWYARDPKRYVFRFDEMDRIP